MSHLRRAARVDRNQSEIVDFLRSAGASVYVVGKPLDLLVGFRGVNYLLEVKDGAKPPSARKLTPAQVKFRAEWRGQIAIVADVDQAAMAIGLEMKDWA